MRWADVIADRSLQDLPEGDVLQYPDSGKVGMSSGRQPDSDWPPKFTIVAKFYDESVSVDYWKGE